MLMYIPREMIELIIQNMFDKDKCKFIMTCKEMSNLNFVFVDEINISRIINSRWYDKFTKIGIYYEEIWPDKFPYHLNHLVFLPNAIFDPKKEVIRVHCDGWGMVKLSMLPTTIKYFTSYKEWVDESITKQCEISKQKKKFENISRCCYNNYSSSLYTYKFKHANN